MDDDGIIHLEWEYLYNKSWVGEIIPESFSHPAKFARGLILKIYQFLFDEGLLLPGMVVIDPFGGVGLGGLDCMVQGCHWIGVELEQKFVILGEQNIEFWNKRYAGKLPHWGTARLIQGDSRKLSLVLNEAGLIVSSPPYAGALVQKTVRPSTRNTDRMNEMGGNMAYGSTEGNLGNLRADETKLDAIVSSAPFIGTLTGDSKPHGLIGRGDEIRTNPRHPGEKLGINNLSNDYGNTDGQLGATPAGDIDAVISSAPFINEVAQRNKQFTMPNDTTGKVKADYGDNPKNLGNLKSGDVDTVISSPPYAELDLQSGGWKGDPNTDPRTKTYNKGNPENLGNVPNETFWEAAKIILEQCHQVLKPDGIAVFVCKDSIKKKKRVPFSRQWARLCESVGFRQTHWIEASLIEKSNIQHGLEGGRHQQIKQRKSFFRLLAEKRGAPRIDHEDVLIFRKIDVPIIEKRMSIFDLPIWIQESPETTEPKQIIEDKNRQPLQGKKTRLDDVEKICPKCGQMTLFDLKGGWKCPFCGFDIMA